MNSMAIASDHNGVQLKEKVKKFLKEEGILVVDLGPYDPNNKVDYVDYANQLGKIVSNNDVDSGILICGTGVGMSIAANRNNNVRAALVHNHFTAPKCREHNDANVLCLGSWITDETETIKIVSTWIGTDFGQGRHVKRVEKLDTSAKVNKIIFTNGVFDILHSGHIELLRFAKSLGDKLIVAINSDSSVKKIKGENRPINCEKDRKSVLESISFIDEVFVFEESNTIEILDKIKPNIIVKGGEWTKDQVRQRDKIPDQIDIKIFPLVKNYSTTETINKIKEIESWLKKY